MLYAQYILFVRDRTDCRTDEAAARIIQGVYETLDMLLPVEQAEALAETLPAEIRPYLGKSRLRYYLDRDQFRYHVARTAGVDPGEAEMHASAVLSVLVEYLPSPALLIVLDGLPNDLLPLFTWRKKAA